MFFDIGAGEFIGLAVLALILVGPDRLPTLAIEAAKLLRKVKDFAQHTTSELKSNLGPGFEDLQPTDLHPKNFIKRQINEAMNDLDKPKIKPKIDPDLL